MLKDLSVGGVEGLLTKNNCFDRKKVIYQEKFNEYLMMHENNDDTQARTTHLILASRQTCCNQHDEVPFCRWCGSSAHHKWLFWIQWIPHERMTTASRRKGAPFMGQHVWAGNEVTDRQQKCHWMSLPRDKKVTQWRTCRLHVHGGKLTKQSSKCNTRKLPKTFSCWEDYIDDPQPNDPN